MSSAGEAWALACMIRLGAGVLKCRDCALGLYQVKHGKGSSDELDSKAYNAYCCVLMLLSMVVGKAHGHMSESTTSITCEQKRQAQIAGASSSQVCVRFAAEWERGGA